MKETVLNSGSVAGPNVGVLSNLHVPRYLYNMYMENHVDSTESYPTKLHECVCTRYIYVYRGFFWHMYITYLHLHLADVFNGGKEMFKWRHFGNITLQQPSQHWSYQTLQTTADRKVVQEQGWLGGKKCLHNGYTQVDMPLVSCLCTLPSWLCGWISYFDTTTAQAFLLYISPGCSPATSHWCKTTSCPLVA